MVVAVSCGAIAVLVGAALVVRRRRAWPDRMPLMDGRLGQGEHETLRVVGASDSPPPHNEPARPRLDTDRVHVFGEDVDVVARSPRRRARHDDEWLLRRSVRRRPPARGLGVVLVLVAIALIVLVLVGTEWGEGPPRHPTPTTTTVHSPGASAAPSTQPGAISLNT